MTYGHVYVGPSRVRLEDNQTVKAFSSRLLVGPSMLIAYSPASPTATTCRSASTAELPSTRLWPLYRSTARSRRARRRSSWTRRRSSLARAVHAQRARFRMVGSRTRCGRRSFRRPSARCASGSPSTKLAKITMTKRARRYRLRPARSRRGGGAEGVRRTRWTYRHLPGPEAAPPFMPAPRRWSTTSTRCDASRMPGVRPRHALALREQITAQQSERSRRWRSRGPFAEALSYFPEPRSTGWPRAVPRADPEIKLAVKLRSSRRSTRDARRLAGVRAEDRAGGADALELNVYTSRQSWRREASSSVGSWRCSRVKNGVKIPARSSSRLSSPRSALRERARPAERDASSFQRFYQPT